MGLAQVHDGFTRLLPSVITVAAMIGSIYLLGLAVRTIFNEPKALLRIGSILLIVAGIAGLKLVTP